MIGEPETVTGCAHHLRLIANDLRTAGDIGLVRLNDDGVAPAEITLADELWLIALQLDGRLSNDEPRAAGETTDNDPEVES